MAHDASSGSAHDRSAAVNWNRAILGAAVIGGVAYGILARGFQVGEPLAGGIAAWLPTAIVSLLMLLMGVLLLRVLRTGPARTAAAALAAAPASGGIIALEIFIVWGVSQLV